jgi:nanoRNase/pAp phosphatase (c-di-AMP/oligoRNAs hydrolase)
MKEKIVQLKELIETSEKILLINHIRMDGDAFGSISALHMLLKKL